MNAIEWTLAGLGIVLALYLTFVAVLYFAGRRDDARALAGFIPDCLVLFRRLVADPRVSRWRKALLLGLLAYLAMPIDLVPDFIPVAGQLVREHWPGPESSLALILRLAYGHHQAVPP